MDSTIAVAQRIARAGPSNEAKKPSPAAHARLRAARRLAEEGRRAEASTQLAEALAFDRSVAATAAVREGEALLAAAS